MFNILCATVLIGACFLASLFLPPNEARAESAPRRQETIDFLASKLKQYSGHPLCKRSAVRETGREGSGWEIEREGDMGVNEVKEFLASDEGVVTMTRSALYGGVIQFNVSEIDVATVRISERVSSTRESRTFFGGGSYTSECHTDHLAMIMQCKTGTCIEERYLSSDGIKRRKKDTIEITFPRRHLQEAERVARGFRHLIYLYTGQKPKELFE